MKRLLMTLCIAIMLFSSCSKDEDINVPNLVGTWDECYDNPYFIMEGIVEYTFYDNGTYQVYSYDALSHQEHTRTNTYVLQDDLLILNTEYSENALRYHIVKCKKDEMAWQKEGTEYSEVYIPSTKLLSVYSHKQKEKHLFLNHQCCFIIHQ